MFDLNRELTAEEVELVLKADLTVPQLRDFWTRFPDQNLDTAIGGCKMELNKKESSKLLGEESAVE